MKRNVVLDDDVEDLIAPLIRKKGDLSKIINEAIRNQPRFVFAVPKAEQHDVMLLQNVLKRKIDACEQILINLTVDELRRLLES